MVRHQGVVKASIIKTQNDKVTINGQLLSKNQIDILVLISDYSFINAEDLAKRTGISFRKVKEIIKKLKKKGLLKRHDGGKGGYWEVIDS